jgi:hypothetical protein
LELRTLKKAVKNMKLWNKEETSREKTIEIRLVKTVKLMGGLALKLVSPGLDGVPDRLVLLPHERLCFVEFKVTGKKLRPLQEKRKRQ